MFVEYVVRDWQLRTGNKFESSLDNFNNNKHFLKLTMSLNIQL